MSADWGNELTEKVLAGSGYETRAVGGVTHH